MTNRRTYERHPLEITPLVFGLVFLGIVAAWGLFELEVVDRADAAWILPIVLIVAGALGVLLATTKPRRERSAAYTPTAAPPEPWPAQTYPEHTSWLEAEPTPGRSEATGDVQEHTGQDTEQDTEQDTVHEQHTKERHDD